MEDDDDEFGDLYTDVLIPFAASSSSPLPDLNLNPDPVIPYTAPHPNSDAPSSNYITPPEGPPVDKEEESADRYRVLHGGESDAKSEDKVLQDSNKEPVSAIDHDSGRGEVDGNGVDLIDKEVKFDIEDDDGGDDGIGDVGLEPVIPGILFDGAGGGGDGDGGGEGDDWDSDSDDDLQIVLNDNNHIGEMVDDDDEDEDGGLVIVANDENLVP